MSTRSTVGPEEADGKDANEPKGPVGGDLESGAAIAFSTTVAGAMVDAVGMDNEKCDRNDDGDHDHDGENDKRDGPKDVWRAAR